MPISKSAKKALSSSEHKASHNRYRKTLLKDALKQAKVSIDQPKEEVESLFSKAYSAIDKAVKWGIIHQNKGARLKSHVAKSIPSETPKVKTTKATAPKKASVKAKAKKAVK